MSPSPTTLQWTTAFILLALFSWVLLSLLWEIVPTPWANTDKPQKRVMGITLLVVIGLLNYSFASEVLRWVWMGIRHLMGLDLEGL
jgi:hypothetical protein